jgi:hypothetical protein
VVLLDIGGQVANGVRQSVNGRFVSYAWLVSAVSAYLDGYAHHKDPRSQVIVAIGTNNDLLTSAASGRAWADRVVDPLRTHAAHYGGVQIDGASDIEPGFANGPAASRQWERAYLHATSAPLLYNGSADGCSTRHVRSGCAGGWKSTDVASLAGAAAPSRISALPQIYNNTQAKQWALISHAAVTISRHPLKFAGVLTENAACGRDPDCPTMPLRWARRALFNALRADPVTRVRRWPAGTDLDVH